MDKGTRSLTGFLLSALIGTTSALPVFAQTQIPTPESSIPATPLPPAPVQSPMPVPDSMPIQVPTPVQAPTPVQPQIYSTAPEQAETAYTLGTGDAIRVELFDTPEVPVEPRYTVLLDGTINLPLVRAVEVQGLTLEQASEKLTRLYRTYLQEPIVTVSLISPRALKIGVIGEVNRPGSYIISLIGSESSQTSLGQRNGASEVGAQWPTVSRAIQTAGGITQIANIRGIQVRRPIAPDRTNIINVNLWQFLSAGDLTQDLRLRDGDTIVIPKATILSPDEVNQVAVSNFSPEFIRINVVGEVNSPGAVSIRPNTTLNQAVLAAGGLKYNRASLKNVDLIRLNLDGSITKRRISLNFSQGVNEQTNPPMQNNDIVVVNRNGLAKVIDPVGLVLGPLSGTLGLLSVFGILGGR
jgi:polysaccharide export outer membrane protein